jgi:ABC-2 type transport system permease protein
LALLPLLIALPWIREYLTFPHDLWRFALGLPAMAMSAVIQFTIAYCFGLLTFWFLEIQSFIILSMAIETLLGGQVFPLDLMPHWLYTVSQYLPYYYQLYFPVAIFTGRLSDSTQVLHGLALQAFWMCVLLGFAQLLWQRGLRRHTAVGG